MATPLFSSLTYLRSLFSILISIPVRFSGLEAYLLRLPLGALQVFTIFLVCLLLLLMYLEGKRESVAEVTEEFVTLEEAQSAPHFVQPLPERLEVHEGESARLECRVEAKPKADVHWLYEDRPLDVTSDASKMVYESTVTDEGQINLLILEALEEDQGLYRCEVVNDLGTAHSQTQLVVTNGQFQRLV